ncbi:hypothetical protein EDB92DRAFT_1823306 [Lactarius akahatsu]|uniref:Uncharacterized protein n=1 Tax=Lactarius akahatsu TaxID=416441 RepID=A0AAD4L978_9AGAM|nr:hypothetical protein EDB92DRAFT_1823306 [Lactarius akahatsu]
MLEAIDATDRKESLEDHVLQELIRINQLKGIEWSGQRSKRGVRDHSAMVNTESYFVTRHPRNPTLLAIYMTTLVMYVLYRLPRRGAAVLLAGMRSILNSQESLRSLAGELLKDPRKLLMTYDLDPVTRSYVCCPSCHFLYEYSLIKTNKRKASISFDDRQDSSEKVDSEMAEDSRLVVSIPKSCTHRWVPSSSSCGEPLFCTVTINAKTYTIPLCKYEVQDLKQWVGRLLSRPTIEEHIFKAFWRPRKQYMEDMWDAGHLCKILLRKGLFQNHCRQVWGINASTVGGDRTASSTTKTTPRPSDSEMKKWYDIIRATEQHDCLLEQLNGRDCARDTLWHICTDHNLRRTGNKWQLAITIVEWRQATSLDVIKVPASHSTEKARHSSSTAFFASETETDDEPRSVQEGSITTDDLVASARTLSEDQIPSEDQLKDVKKCFQQLIDHAARNTVLRAKKIVLQFVCRDSCKMSQDKLKGLRTKEELYVAAAGWDILEAIWGDMDRTELPSWVTRAPLNWGTAAWGKLSVNNWRVVCTIHLPITLIRLWGGDDAPGDRKAMLENFMDLVRAVQLVNLRSISRDEIKLYEEYIFRYMTTFKSLYKVAKVKPIHHAALHYGDILRGFGPAHTHGAAFYKRYIHSMQSKNHNMKLGELELTFMRASMREANLQALLADDSEVRSHVGDLLEAYKSTLSEDVRGTRLAHLIDAVHLTQQTDFAYDRKRLRESRLPDAVLTVFIQFLYRKHPDLRAKDSTGSSSTTSVSAQFLDKFSLRGVQYSTATCWSRDSHLFFRSPQHEKSGQITHIFFHTHVPDSPSSSSWGQASHPSVYLCMQPYAPLQHSPDLREIDQRNEFAPPVIIEPSDIICHIAVTPLEISGHEVVHILPMDRLMQACFMRTEDLDVDDLTEE